MPRRAGPKESVILSTNLVQTVMELSNRERLGEHICRVICYMYLLHNNISYNNIISDMMVLDVDMLDLGVISIILDQMDSTLTI